MIKTLIFDIGQVLIEVDIHNFIKNLARAMNVSRWKIYLMHDRTIFHELMMGLKTMADIHLIFCQRLKREIELEKFREIWLSIIIQPKNDIIGLVQQLSLKYPLTILSNIDAVHYDYFQKNMTFLNYFSPHFLSYRMRLAKPDPAIYHQVLQQLNARPEECYFIDDRKENILAARKLGIVAHHFKNYKKLTRDMRNNNII
ncbi:HAD family phosphatase [candidate division KSB1 bacterium]|nr:HAD family phosphatase [candidate division KSB1 bacterium]